MKLRKIAVLALVLALAGCYHAVIETGKPAGSQVVENPWAMSFVAGLVPPPQVDVASECPNGVSKVETKHSFLNMLVGGLTSGIITPMHIKVTCASGGMEEPEDGVEVIDVESTDFEELAAALERAATRSFELMGAPVYVVASD